MALSTPGTRGAEMEEMGVHKGGGGRAGQSDSHVVASLADFLHLLSKPGPCNFLQVDGHLALCANYSTRK